MQEHPVLSAASIATLIASIIALLVAFGVPITDEMKIGILGVVAAVVPFLVYFPQRGKTTALVNPKDNQGNELVKKTDGQPPLQAVQYRARRDTKAL